MNKAERSRQLRYKKAALAELGYEQIRDSIYNMTEECDNIRWVMDGDIDTLTNALDGDEEEAYEFRMMFAELSAECEQLWSAIDEYEEQHFDDCSVALIGNRFEAVGYDDFQEDYYSLTSYESELAVSESGKRIMCMTKPEMLQEIGRTLGIILSFQNVQYKYEYLKATMDILNGENTSYLQMIKDIESAYEKANEDGFHDWEQSARNFDRLIGALPDKTWIE